MLLPLNSGPSSLVLPSHHTSPLTLESHLSSSSSCFKSSAHHKQKRPGHHCSCEKEAGQAWGLFLVGTGLWCCSLSLACTLMCGIPTRLCSCTELPYAVVFAGSCSQLLLLRVDIRLIKKAVSSLSAHPFIP